MLTVKLFQRAEKVQDSCLLQRISPVSFVYRSPRVKDQESGISRLFNSSLLVCIPTRSKKRDIKTLTNFVASLKLPFISIENRTAELIKKNKM